MEQYETLNVIPIPTCSYEAKSWFMCLDGPLAGILINAHAALARWIDMLVKKALVASVDTCRVVEEIWYLWTSDTKNTYCHACGWGLLKSCTIPYCTTKLLVLAECGQLHGIHMVSLADADEKVQHNRKVSSYNDNWLCKCLRRRGYMLFPPLHETGVNDECTSVLTG